VEFQVKNNETQLISKQIERAKTAVINKKCFFYPASQNNVMEFMNLDIDSSDEIWPLISELLNELIPQHRAKTNFKALDNLSPQSEPITFIWHSERLKKKVQLTFILLSDNFYYFSLS